MNNQPEQMKKIEAKIHHLYFKEAEAKGPLERFYYKKYRWIMMVYHEAIQDDLAIRAESLSYFALFAIMPLLAGAFLLLSFFSQWGPVQDQFQKLLEDLLGAFPGDQRQSIMVFILDFKDQYLRQINEKSATLGVFALGVLIWIAVKMFMNLEALINLIWRVSEQRTRGERIQNFIFCSVILPLIWLVALSFPAVLNHFFGGHWGVVSQSALPTVILFLGLSFLFRYIPNIYVSWKSAISGAAVSAVLFFLANFFLRIYFRFGTQTAYGKVAAIPVLAYFIYVLWLIVCLGAEVSYLFQNEKQFIGRKMPSTTLGEAALMVELIKCMQLHYERGQPPLSVDELAHHFRVTVPIIHQLLQVLCQNEIAVEVPPKKGGEDSAYLLRATLGKDELGKFIKEFLDLKVLSANFDLPALMKVLET